MSAMADASACASPGRSSLPSTPGVMSSVNAPWSAATGGTPAAMDSTATRPNVSLHTDGRSTARALVMRSAQSALPSTPASVTEGRTAAHAAISPSSGPPPAMVRRSPASPGIAR